MKIVFAKRNEYTVTGCNKAPKKENGYQGT
jgi:hypothetical protein